MFSYKLLRLNILFISLQDSVILVPYEEWSLDYATPKFYCTTKDGKCTSLEYEIPREGIRVDPDEIPNDPRPAYLINPNIKVRYLGKQVNRIEIDSKWK